MFAFACSSLGSGDGAGDGEEGAEDAHEAESALTSDEKAALCNAIPTPRAWTAEESTRLGREVVQRFLELKRTNDALIRERGVGRYAGARSGVMKRINAGDKSGATADVRAHVKPGVNAASIVDEIQGTSCIGVVYRVLRESYATLGRQNEWAAVEKCGRAWDSDGLHVQQALIKAGWPAPTLGLASDSARPMGSAEEQAMHKEFLRAAKAGAYYGTPVHKTILLQDFLPTPGSSTAKNDAMLLQIGRSKFLAVGTLRGAYHVPLIVPADMIPEEFAPGQGAARTSWLSARERGEPFVLESHSLRQPWDATNFEVRPLTAVIAETYQQSVIYSTGTMLFAPFNESPLTGYAGPAPLTPAPVTPVIPPPQK